MQPGHRPGDERVRLPRRRATVQIAPAPIRARRKRQDPALVFLYGFAGLIALGTVLLMLPVSSAEGRWTPFVDALFTSTSAVCVTGLVVVDTATYWSGVGEVVILGLIQLGGFGFMTSSSCCSC